MNHLKIRIQSLEDEKQGMRIMPDEELEGFEVFETNDMTVGIMESAIVSGQPVVCFVTKNHENKTITVFQMTANNFFGLVQAYNGAVQRFVDLRAKKN